MCGYGREFWASRSGGIKITGGTLDLASVHAAGSRAITFAAVGDPTLEFVVGGHARRPSGSAPTEVRSSAASAARSESIARLDTSNDRMPGLTPDSTVAW